MVIGTTGVQVCHKKMEKVSYYTNVWTKKDNLYRENKLLFSFLILMATLFTASYMFKKSHVYIPYTIKSIFAISNERQMLFVWNCTLNLVCYSSINFAINKKQNKKQPCEAKTLSLRLFTEQFLRWNSFTILDTS